MLSAVENTNCATPSLTRDVCPRYRHRDPGASMLRIPALAPLFVLALGTGCGPLCFSSVCGCKGGVTPDQPFDEELPVWEEEWDEAVAEAEGDEEAACAALCAEPGFLPGWFRNPKVDTCEAEEATTGGPDDSGAEDSAAEGLRVLHCTGTAGYVTMCMGRPPLRGSRTRRARSFGGCLARAAEDEAGAVLAFAELAQSLRTHGAPAALVAGAWRASREEAGHAAAQGRLARRAGARPVSPKVRPASMDLLTLAVHNARHGAVGETWAALLAAHQATAAPDPERRAVYARIARDELSHARLAWAIDAWAGARLGPQGAALLRLERQEAGRRVGLPATERRHAVALGLPDVARTAALAKVLQTALWA